MLESNLKKLQRIKNSVIPDVLDNFGRKNAPPIAERKFENPEDSLPVLERLCPEKIRIRLRELTKDFDQSVTYRARISVNHGGAKHPHDFVVEKNNGVTSFHFVDPEHFVGKRTLRRPSISNLMSLRLADDTGELPEIAIVRFRTKTIAESDITQLKMERQLNHTRTLIENDGLPALLKNNPEEVTFRTVVTPREALIQSRYIGEEGLKNFLDGRSPALVLEGKITSQQAVLQSFIRLLETGKFEPVKEKRATN
ncbi:MAG: hypothetical protein Q8R25_04595 [bacterium]|nr:hypothetical protein [bacterium]